MPARDDIKDLRTELADARRLMGERYGLPQFPGVIFPRKGDARAVQNLWNNCHDAEARVGELTAALRQTAQTHHGLCDEHPHDMHATFEICPAYECQRARIAIDGSAPKPSETVEAGDGSRKSETSTGQVNVRLRPPKPIWRDPRPQLREGSRYLSGRYSDPAYVNDQGMFYFYNETWTDMLGPFMTRAEMETALNEYARSL